MDKLQDETTLHSTDLLMRGLWQSLYRDFSAVDEDIKLDCASDLARVKTGAIATYRSAPKKSYWWANKYYFKRRYQLDSLFKRYRFMQDLYSDKEVSDRTYSAFFDTQKRISSGFTLTPRSARVIEKARQLVAEILGDYDHFEHAQSCRFGKRASEGVPRHESYLDVKSSILTGSQDHIEWFRYHLLWDETLAQALVRAPFQAVTKCCDVLGLTDVPKNHKSRRIILKNTTIGAFYTSGLGKMIQRRLLKVGLNIKKLQQIHRRLVKGYSKHLRYVTADLSSASDSFTIQHLELLLPDAWYKACLYGRIPEIKLKDKRKRFTLSSIMTMGVGFTFPMQTLLFYCLLKAIASLANVRGRISVYGDDLIYPIELHRYVTVVFEELGFILNADKTFTHLAFRESCGSDFYCGLDVRPFQPEGEGAMLKQRAYEMLLYKTINGLLARWSKEDIPKTYHYLMVQLSNVTDEICQVPPAYPESSGIRVDSPSNDFYIPYSGIRVVRTKRGDHYEKVYKFKVLTLQPGKRYVYNQYIYLWDYLRTKLGAYAKAGTRECNYLSGNCESDANNFVGKEIVFVPHDPLLNPNGGQFIELHTPTLFWSTVPKPRQCHQAEFRSERRRDGKPSKQPQLSSPKVGKHSAGNTGRVGEVKRFVRGLMGARLARLVPFVPSKSGSARIKRNTVTVSTWL